MSDETAMRRALRLSLLGRHASPNPMVGCVILDACGAKVGEGYHARPGEAHAEAVALAEAGDCARGGTAYVTLEPCSHFGRTPPCADRLIEAGVVRVVAAVEDPDIRVRGAGLARLANAGIAVTAGVCAAEARAVNIAFFHHRLTGSPYVIVKTAMTLDGRIATANGDSRWITSVITRKWVHRLRDRADAVLVGIGTVLADDPALTTRLDHRDGRDPLRIVLDTHLRTPLDSRVVTASCGRAITMIVCGEHATIERRAQLEGRGVLVKTAPTADDGKVDLRALMADLGTNHGIQTVLAEGGSQVISGLLGAGLVNRYIAAIAPKLIGGSGSPGPVGGAGLADAMSGAVRIGQWRVRRSGLDIVIDGTVEREMV